MASDLAVLYNGIILSYKINDNYGEKLIILPDFQKQIAILAIDFKTGQTPAKQRESK